MVTHLQETETKTLCNQEIQDFMPLTGVMESVTCEACWKIIQTPKKDLPIAESD